MAAHSNTNTPTPGYVLINHIYERTIEIKSTAVVTPTNIFSQTVTTTTLTPPGQPNRQLSTFSRVYPVNVSTQIPATQGFQTTPVRGGFSPLTGTVMNSTQSSYEPAGSSSDGRIHSLPTRKYGPYVCPKCNHAYVTSQAFAGHVHSHYRDETIEEREVRLASRKRKPSTTLQLGNGGATVGSSTRKQRAEVMAGVKPEPEV